MGAATIKLVSQGGIGGSAAFPVRPDNLSLVGGGSQMQGGRSSAAASAQTATKMAVCSVVGSTTYVAGGDTCDWSVVGFDAVVAVVPVGVVGRLAAALHVLEYDYTNSKAIIRQCAGAGAAMSEVANGDRSSDSFTCWVFGT